jgi:hypothetical protein
MELNEASSSKSVMELNEASLMMELNEASNLEQTNLTHKYLTISAKGKFKWRGNFQGLQDLINQQLGLQTE